jgi:hypothetical protein
VLATIVAVVGTWPSVAGSATQTVTVRSGPTSTKYFAGECNDAVQSIDVSDSFVVARDVAGGPQDVRYRTSGSAVAGTDYDVLPGVVTIPAGVDEVSVPVRVRASQDGSRHVSLTITAEPSADYSLGDPATATIELIVPRDRSLPPVDCNPTFQLTDAATNTHQTIRVGGRPVPIRTTFEPESFNTELVDGSLPTGVTLDPGAADSGDSAVRGGAFRGAASRTGAFVATFRVCPVNIVFTCRADTLTVNVLPRRAEIPQTGRPIIAELIGAASLIAIGITLRRAAASVST